MSCSLSTSGRIQKAKPHTALSLHFCVMCLNSSEKVDHLFIHCAVASALWSMLLSMVDMVWIVAGNFNDFIGQSNASHLLARLGHYCRHTCMLLHQPFGWKYRCGGGRLVKNVTTYLAFWATHYNKYRYLDHNAFFGLLIVIRLENWITILL